MADEMATEDKKDPEARETEAKEPELDEKAGAKAQKDPLRPKKPKTASLFFSEATRAELFSSNPGIRIDKLSKLITEEWKKLSEDARAPYVQLATEDKARYRKEMSKYGGEEEEEEEEGEEDADDEVDLKAENKALREQISELEKQSAKQQKLVEVLQGKLASKALKAATGAKDSVEGKAAEAKAPKRQKLSDDPEAPSEDPAHYFAWIKGVLGANGEKADSDALSALQSKGAKGLAKLLVKPYLADHS